jgi:hypothetical protein
LSRFQVTFMAPLASFITIIHRRCLLPGSLQELWDRCKDSRESNAVMARHIEVVLAALSLLFFMVHAIDSSPRLKHAPPLRRHLCVPTQVWNTHTPFTIRFLILQLTVDGPQLGLKALRGGCADAALTVVFSIECLSTTADEEVGIVGSCPELGYSRYIFLAACFLRPFTLSLVVCMKLCI